jgi:hypothetical protein
MQCWTNTKEVDEKCDVLTDDVAAVATGVFFNRFFSWDGVCVLVFVDEEAAVGSLSSLNDYLASM